MSIIAEFTLSLDRFALADAFAAVPEMTVEVERVMAHPSDLLLPYVWTLDADPAAITDALDRDPTIREATKMERADGGILYRVRWGENAREVARSILSEGPVILTGTATSEGWDFQVRFEGHEHLSTFREMFDGMDASPDIKRLHTSEMPTVDGEFLLTSKQREALETALDAGYFEVPRETNLSELADDLDISSQALSKRLRRAQATLSQQVLTTGPDAVTDQPK